MLRVGRRVGTSDASYEGFEKILVLTKSYSKYGMIGPYELRDEEGRIFENFYQSHKVYKYVPEIRQPFSRWDPTVIWEHPAEKHTKHGEPNKRYFRWRKKLAYNPYAVR